MPPTAPGHRGPAEGNEWVKPAPRAADLLRKKPPNPARLALWGSATLRPALPRRKLVLERILTTSIELVPTPTSQAGPPGGLARNHSMNVVSQNANHRHRGVSHPRLAGRGHRTCSGGTQHWPRPVLVVAALGVLTCISGCSVWHLAHRTMYSELSQYPQLTDAKLSCRQYQRWAKDEWQRIIDTTGGGGYSSDYASGFIQGFVDQVYAGGNVQAPPMPPRKYWRVGYRNQRGRQAVQEWYGGFRHGAQVAKEGGYRQQAVIPSSLLGEHDPPAGGAATRASSSGRDAPTRADTRRGAAVSLASGRCRTPHPRGSHAGGVG